jgi:hypothetical protein
MRMVRFAVGVLIGAVLGVSLLLVGGLQAPDPPQCPHCAVMTHPFTENHCYPQAVVGGWICS